ncbi:S-methyl-5-thioribose-1-phosphate isomerase, partial [Candidatus Bathyarchaeota archaeon]|nr:S-methyl-5-thioribose-1-phosphate isomerase [Candidatus Bathyarchaeota archaeon]NIR15890.1 S-methyl-5-thioribose-1-phosphate isomerase [Desulfobacterales bacterium]NIU81109.1 S-methyl-5-thioribose-1-phosphate isomerase [Candidatus Bathyarchaeota archaeon]NIV67745.1 S-methyl-5-thioribose-1-phosphate isomerase [Candidatus Bathyarchaeota archaeon]NIW16235.1 S-methyl-5-thioribose-1-phosphate isomerase [Candidatus Bathyarchaeota archaeon]
FWGVDQVLETARETAGEVGDLAQAVVDKAQKMADEDVAVNRRIGEHGAKLIQDGDVVLTHCNAGSLATVDYGTALGVIRAAREEGKKVN